MPLYRPPLPIKPPRPEQDGDLYLAVLPLVHYSRFFAGAGGEQFEEVMTLVPDRKFATEFPAKDVDRYIQTFSNAVDGKYGERTPVPRWNYELFDAGDEKVYVVVTPYAK